MRFISELIRFLLARRKFWLWPMLLAGVMMGGLIIATKGSVVAPFIYTLF